MPEQHTDPESVDMDPQEEPDAGHPSPREPADPETEREGTAGEGLERRGTLPGSVGGSTGTSGRSAGTQTPGASAPDFVGIDPDEARRKRGKKGRE